MFEESTVSAL